MRASLPLCVVFTTAILLGVVPATAQTQISLRGFGDLGLTRFTAGESFDAILGSASGVVFGGGAEAVFPSGAFAGIRASRFRKTGERVAIVDGERFGLGIPATITVTPLQVTGGYRFNRLTRTRRPSRVVPFAGGGIGWYRLTETSDFATDAENVSGWHIGVHALGGAEVRLTPLVGIAGEAQWSIVPGALGDDANGVSQLFDESDLGGLTLRVKLVLGIGN